MQLVDAPGARVVTGHVTRLRPGMGSVTPTEESVTLPVLRTVKVYVSVSPREIVELVSASVVSAADLAMVIVANWVSGVVTLALGESIEVPAGDVAVACAVLLIEPASTSSWETTYVAVHRVDTPGGSDVTAHVIAFKPGSGSEIVSALSVTLPVLRTVKA